MHAPHGTQPTFQAWIFFIKMACIGHGLDPEGKKLSRAKDSLPEFFRAEPSKRLNILIFSSRVEPKAQFLDMPEPS
jgi:hypothetical protein